MAEPYSSLSEQEAEQERRSDYDVTNEVLVTSPSNVLRAIRELFDDLYPHACFDSVWLACYDFERMFSGRDPDYHGIDTPYHDIQHTLDVTLAMARLLAGHDRSVATVDRLGPERVKFALVSALFHDSGYLRHKVLDAGAVNGAEFTRSHVSRSGRFLESYLPRIGLEQFAPVVTRVVHFTGFEVPLNNIELEDPKDNIVGHLLGTADLIAQMADRCYLEKCRDRLYPEFVLGNVAIQATDDGTEAQYYSGLDLLFKTMDYYRNSAQYRLEHSFHRAYRYAEAVFDNGKNPYIAFLRKNLSFLAALQQQQDWDRLRRRAPCAIPYLDGEARLMMLALQRLREVSEKARQNRHGKGRGRTMNAAAG